MRILQFRAWDSLDKKMMGPWDWDDILSGRMTIHPSGDRCPVMPFTGLSDKNGKPIYEGDIIAGRYRPYGPSPLFYTLGTVEFQAPAFGIRHFGYWYDEERINRYQYEEKDEISKLLHDWKSDFAGQVIGNIYESPELLTK